MRRSPAVPIRKRSGVSTSVWNCWLASTNDRVRLHHQIELTESKGTALFSMLGYAHPDVERTFAQASALCDQEGSSPPLRVLYGLWAVHITRSNREAIEALLPRFRVSRDIWGSGRTADGACKCRSCTRSCVEISKSALHK